MSRIKHAIPFAFSFDERRALLNVSEGSGFSVEQARKFLDDFNKAYPLVAKWAEKMRKKGREGARKRYEIQSRRDL